VKHRRPGQRPRLVGNKAAPWRASWKRQEAHFPFSHTHDRQPSRRERVLTSPRSSAVAGWGRDAVGWCLWYHRPLRPCGVGYQYTPPPPPATRLILFGSAVATHLHSKVRSPVTGCGCFLLSFFFPLFSLSHRFSISSTPVYSEFYSLARDSSSYPFSVSVPGAFSLPDSDTPSTPSSERPQVKLPLAGDRAAGRRRGGG
jgi:hypothetical protein